MIVPPKFRQNETVSWKTREWYDELDNGYTNAAYALTWIFAGPSSNPILLNAATDPTSNGWIATIDPVTAAKFVPGTYWYQGVLAGPSQEVVDQSFRNVIQEGEITVEPDYSALTGTFDNRTQAEQILGNLKAAKLSLSTGQTKSYRIGTREYTFQDLAEINSDIMFWTARVVTEKSIAGGARDRFILVRNRRVHW